MPAKLNGRNSIQSPKIRNPQSPNPQSIIMRLKDLVVVTGFPGVQKVAANRNNGMLIEDLDSGKVRFAPIRKHQFSPLETISVFVEGEDDSVEIRQVFQSMYDKLADTPVPTDAAKSEVLRDYFGIVLPNHDRDRVHISDIKKIVKWFHFLHERGYMTMEEEVEDEEE
jgi:hypothetical protein